MGRRLRLPTKISRIPDRMENSVIYSALKINNGQRLAITMTNDKNNWFIQQVRQTEQRPSTIKFNAIKPELWSRIKLKYS